MPESDEDPTFVVVCEDCQMDRTTDELDEALTFAVKHHQHTGHSIAWKRSALLEEITSIPQRTHWRVRCHTCDTQRVFLEKGLAEQFADEHETYTGHSSQDPERIETPKVSELDPSDVEAVLDYCFEQAESVDVVPTEVVLRTFEEAGVSRKRTSTELSTVEYRSNTYHLGDGFLAR